MRAAMDSHTSCKVDMIAAEDVTSSLGLLSLPFESLLQSKSPTCLGASINLPNEDCQKLSCSGGYPGFDVTMLPDSKGYTDKVQTLLTPRRGRSPIKYTRAVNKPKRRRTLKFELIMPEARLQKEEADEEADAANEPQRVEITLDNLRFTNEEAVRMAAKEKGWAPFTNRVTGENGFYIPEVTDTVVYASWERGLQMLPRADAWLAESGKDVPTALTTRLQDQEAQQIEQQRRLAKEELHKLEQERLLLEEERRKIEHGRQAAEQDRICAEEALRKAEEEEALRKKTTQDADQERIRVEGERRKKEEREQLDKDRREFAAEMKKSREEEEARIAAEAGLAADKQAAADADSEVELERLRQQEEAQKRDLMRAEDEAAEKARKRELEKQRFLRKDHGKQAFGYLAHEGALDRQVWGRPDDNLKRLGLCDPNHVASGGVPHAPGSGPNPKKHVEALEQAVRANLDRARREQLLQEEAARGSCWMKFE